MLAEKQYLCVLLHEFTVRQENKKIQNESYVEIFPQIIIINYQGEVQSKVQTLANNLQNNGINTTTILSFRKQTNKNSCGKKTTFSCHQLDKTIIKSFQQKLTTCN